jgi:3-oxoacyl-[acyl-carrier-protein] synthase II
MKRRAVITLAGIVGPQALNVHEFWDLVRSGNSAIRHIRRFNAVPTGCQIGGEVPEFSLDFIPAKFKPKRLARHTHLLLKAAQQLQQALPSDGNFSLRIGLATSDCSIIADSGFQRAKHGYEASSPLLVSQSPPHAAAGALSMFLGCRGEVQTVSTACAAGMDAIGLAARDVVRGNADLVIAGGADAAVASSPLSEFVRCGMASLRSKFPEKSSRPFDAFADSGVLSEAAGLLFIEEAGAAQMADRQPLCEIIGYANFGDSDSSRPGGGYVESMIRALDSAGIDGEDLDGIFAWGPGHPVLDRAEAEALLEVFGERLRDIPITSIKGVIGNPLAGAGPLQVAAAAFSLSEGLIPPTANHEVPLFGVDLDIVTGVPLLSRPKTVLLNAHGVGGSNCSLILRRWKNDKKHPIKHPHAYGFSQ